MLTKRTPRTYSLEFKQDALRMCQQPGMTMAEVSRNLGVHVSLLGKWKRKMTEEKGNQKLTESERLELARLREENKRLRMEREILKKAAAFLANEKA